MAATGAVDLLPTAAGAKLTQRVERRILFIRGEKVMLDGDLAELYGVSTGALNQAVRRNGDRFPTDFMFQLTPGEVEGGRFETRSGGLKSQFVISKGGRGGRRHLPYAFTEQGVAMLSSVLRSKRAVQVNIAIMRAFVRLRELLATHKELARKLEELERRYDRRFRVVFVAIRQLMAASQPTRRIGF